MGRVKTSWDPCARCGREGPTRPQRKTPERISGSAVGFVGTICQSCYTVLRRNPYSVLSPEMYGRKRRVKVEDLATLVMEFRRRMDNASLNAMVEMAEKALTE